MTLVLVNTFVKLLIVKLLRFELFCELFIFRSFVQYSQNNI